MRHALPFIILAAIASVAPKARAVPAKDLPSTQAALGVPAALAQVVDAEGGPARGLPQVLLIQDVHHHPEVQAEIAAILLFGRRHWSLRRVFIEGAWSAVDVGALRRAHANEPLIRLVRAGRLTGPEMASLMTEHLALTGLEDEALYRAHVQAYQAAIQERDGARRELRTIRLLAESFDVSKRTYDKPTLERLENLIDLRLRPSEYGALRAQEPARPASPALREAVMAAEAFYECADARSLLFVDRLLAAEGPEPRIAVVGGFHTALMAEQLRKRGVSFAVLSPRVTQPAIPDRYRERMVETISALRLR